MWLYTVIQLFEDRLRKVCDYAWGEAVTLAKNTYENPQSALLEFSIKNYTI